MPLAGALATLDDWCNPIAVKELRQAVQSKFIPGLLMLCLVGQLVAMASVVLTIDETEASFDAGRRVFLILFGILVGACTLFVPAYCAGRLIGERSGGKIDLLFVSTLRPGTIVWGKLCSGLAISVLLFSACMPFLVFTTLLRGIDIPSIFVLLVNGFLASAVAIQLALFVGAVPASRPVKAVLGLFSALVALWLLGGIMSSTLGFLFFGVGSSVVSGQFWVVFFPAALLVLGVLGHLFVWTVALLSPRSSNRALPVRVFSTIAWFVTGVVCLVARLFYPYDVLTGFWAFLSLCAFCVGLFIAVCEREEPGRRVARTIPAGGWRRALAFLFYSGAAGGVAWACVMIFLTVFAFVVISNFPPGVGGRVVGVMVGMGAGAFACAMTALLIRRAARPAFKPEYTWMVALSFAVVSLFVLSGIGPGGCLALILVWAIFVGCGSLRWFTERVHGFRRPGEAPARPPIASTEPPPEPPRTSQLDHTTEETL